jgi:hypothetical protein
MKNIDIQDVKEIMNEAPLLERKTKQEIVTIQVDKKTHQELAKWCREKDIKIKLVYTKLIKNFLKNPDLSLIFKD